MILAKLYFKQLHSPTPDGDTHNKIKGELNTRLFFILESLGFKLHPTQDF